MHIDIYIYMYIYIYIAGTQISSVLIGKGLVVEGSTRKIEDKQVPGIYLFVLCIFMYFFIVDKLVGIPGSKVFKLSESNVFLLVA